MSTKHSSKSAHSEDRLALHLRLLQEAVAGHFDDLECPECRQVAVSVWFTHPEADTYRTWFVCADCGFHTRVQNTERPQFFSENRVSAGLEERDLSILKQAVFKRPPQRLTVDKQGSVPIRLPTHQIVAPEPHSKGANSHKAWYYMPTWLQIILLLTLIVVGILVATFIKG